MTEPTQCGLRNELEQALDGLEAQGKKETAVAIRPIVLENLERGREQNRVQRFLAAGPELSPCDYVLRVAGYYEALSDYLYRLQVKKSTLVWEPLFEQMQLWAFNYLRLKQFSRNGQTFQQAKDCAASAAGEMVQAYFPYDTDFDAWAFIIVQNHCKKMIAGLMRAGYVPDYKQVPLGDIPPMAASTADLGNGRLTEWRLALLQLIEQLPPDEKMTVLLYTFEGLTLEEIGQQLGLSTTTVHRRYFSAIEFLRGHLILE